jgi:hypothetical protein
VQEETLLAQTLTNALIGAQVQFNQALDNIRINTLNQLNSNVVCALFPSFKIIANHVRTLLQ